MECGGSFAVGQRLGDGDCQPWGHVFRCMGSGDTFLWTRLATDGSQYFVGPAVSRCGFGGYLLLSRSGPLGEWGWLFSLKAMVLAQAVLVFPVVAALTRQCVEDADRLHGEQLQSLGAGTALRSLLLVWDERYACLTIVITAFGRATSEVGAVMVVGGNIEGFTRVMTTAIALETSKGDLPLALALGLVLLMVVLCLNIGVAVLSGWRKRVDGATSDPLHRAWV